MIDGFWLANLKKGKVGSRVMEDGEVGRDKGSSAWGGVKEEIVRDDGWGDPWSG